jgi:hypothetical protein
VHSITAQGSNGGGLYIDDTTTNVLARGNLWYDLKGGAIQWNKQAMEGVVNLTNNVWVKSNNNTYSPVNTHAFFNWNRGGAVNMTRNLIFYDSAADGPLWSANNKEASFHNVGLDYNLYYDTNGKNGGTFTDGKPFPDGLSMREWQQKGHDAHSIVGDPMFVASDKGDFNVSAGSPAETIGFEALNVSDAGPGW